MDYWKSKMVELNYQQISGLLLLVITLSAGSTGILLEETTNFVNCRGEWILENTGQYNCSKDGNLEWCYKIEPRGSGWNRCILGKIIKQEVEVKVEKVRFINMNNNNPLEDYTISPDGKTCYLQGDLRRGFPCAN